MVFDAFRWVFQGFRAVFEDPHQKNPFGDHALNMAAAAGALQAMDILLDTATRPFDFTFTLHNAAPFTTRIQVAF